MSSDEIRLHKAYFSKNDTPSRAKRSDTISKHWNGEINEKGKMRKPISLDTARETCSVEEKEDEILENT